MKGLVPVDQLVQFSHSDKLTFDCINHFPRENLRLNMYGEKHLTGGTGTIATLAPGQVRWAWSEVAIRDPFLPDHIVGFE